MASFVYRDGRPFDLAKLEAFVSLLLESYGADLLRYKGILNIHGAPRRVIFQGVHMVMGSELGKAWGANEQRESVIVFIGKSLPREVFEKGLALCVAGVREAPAASVMQRNG